MSTGFFKRTVPFIKSASSGCIDSLVIDNTEFAFPKVSKLTNFKLIAKSLNLDFVAEQFPAEIAVELVKDQYEVCMNYIFSHPVWKSFREGKDRRSLLAYILETRHYLFAAASRMSTGVSACWQFGPLSLVLSEHLVEEADHAVFFENSLQALGCSKKSVHLSRPSPVTIEWIYLMRSISARDPLVSAVCSGLMEFSAANREAVKGWHQMLIKQNILTEEAVNNFYEHVKLDIELGHGQCWVEALKTQRSISGEKLSECLNAVSIVAEMLYRWFESLCGSSAGRIAEIAPEISFANSGERRIDNYFDGLPVLPSYLLNHAVYGENDNLSESLKNVSALAYHYKVADLTTKQNSRNDLVQGAIGMQKQIAADGFEYSDYTKVEASIKKWLCSIDGHLLWKEMREARNTSLMYGWIKENHYYLSTAYHHCSSAIASCPYSDIRDEFVKHLKEELTHADILQKELKSVKNVISSQLQRPLPTTIAFTGFLKELATYDWKAYCLALAFLQFSLRPGDARHKGFYDTITKKNPKSAKLLLSMRKHDLIDEVMGHENDMKKILELLINKELITEEVVSRASMIAQLCWSFLDGIRVHYKKGPAAVNQRLGWSSNGVAWN